MVEFLPAYEFHLSLARFEPSDAAFSWDARFGGDFDMLRFGAGYLNMLVDFETVAGGELRRLLPNQANYSLDAAAGLQHGPVAGGLVFRHTSRHLIDLPKSEGVDWNLLGAHLDLKRRVRHARVDAHATAGVILRYTSVDYTGEISGAGGVESGIGRRVVLRVAADLDYIKTDPLIAGRMGFLNRGVECAVRVKGQSGTFELFARGERRNDAIPLQTGERTGALLGFRFRFAKD